MAERVVAVQVPDPVSVNLDADGHLIVGIVVLGNEHGGDTAVGAVARVAPARVFARRDNARDGILVVGFADDLEREVGGGAAVGTDWARAGATRGWACVGGGAWAWGFSRSRTAWRGLGRASWRRSSALVDRASSRRMTTCFFQEELRCPVEM